MKFVKTILFVLMANACQAQKSVDSLSSFSTKQYAESYWQNGTKLITQPLHWNGKDWAKTGLVLGTTTALFFADKTVNQFFDNWNKPTAESFGKTGDFLGQGYVLVGGSLVAWGIGAISKNPALKNFGQDALQAQIITGGGTFLAKEIFGRARPFTGLGPGYWSGPLPTKDNVSFFSGHTSLAFSTATMVYLHSHKKWWVGLLSYGAAAGVGVSRMQQSEHWVSDVFMGAVVGTAVSSFVFKQNEKKRSKKVLNLN